jgi:hypothetical protein
MGPKSCPETSVSINLRCVTCQKNEDLIGLVNWLHVSLNLSKRELITVEPGYNDIGLYDTSPIASDILWYQLIPHC